MTAKIRFCSLPFKPKNSEVFFLSSFDIPSLDDAINKEYNRIRRYYRQHSLKFIHLPSVIRRQLVEKKVRYYAPYLSSATISPSSLGRSMFFDHLSNPSDGITIGQSLLFNSKKKGDEWEFDMINIDSPYSVDQILDSAPRIESLCPKRRKAAYRNTINLSSASVVHEAKLCIRNEHKFWEKIPEKADTHYDISTLDESTSKDVESLLRQVKRLTLRGMPLAAIHSIIDKGQILSPMIITDDYRILLPDYNDMEIKMNDLPKTLFFLFLRYPEGIALKELCDHQTELMNIYRELSPNISEEQRLESIQRLCDPTHNSQNEKISRIAMAFREQFEEHLAKNYYPVRHSDMKYRIALDPSLIIWKD